MRLPKNVARRAAGTKLALLTVSIGECQYAKMRKPTTLGATEFSSRVVMVSLTMPEARSRAGTRAHSAPPANPSSIMIGIRTMAGSPGNASAPHVANAAPRYSWPSPPTLIRPTRHGSATASAVSRSGIMATTTSDKP